MSAKVHKLELSDAISFIKKLRNTAIFVSVKHNAPVMQSAERTIPVMANIKITKKDAIKFLNDAYEFYTGRETGIQVRIEEYDSCIFLC